MLKSSSRISRFFASVAFGTAVLCASGAMASTSWVVFDADSGRMLGQDDASAQHAPASLAKMMTLYLTFEALKTGRLHWDDALPISKNAASKVRMKLWLKAGDTISTRDAVNGMIIVSANDAATVMGEYLAGSEAAFARLMTQRARQIGMKSTIFANPSGLTANVSQLTTARDMAVLGMALRRDFPEEYALFSQRSFTFRGRVYNGHNNLMYRYAGVDGIKTGYTNVSGYNLVSSAYINNRHLVGVVLGAGSAGQRDGQMAKLLTRFGGVDNGKAAPSGCHGEAAGGYCETEAGCGCRSDRRYPDRAGGWRLSSDFRQIELAHSAGGNAKPCGCQRIAGEICTRGFQDRARRKGRNLAFAQGSQSLSRAFFRRQGFGCRKQGLRAAQAPANRLPGYSELESVSI
ncbi:hypothetical protein C086_01014 [Brucella abortus F6/05-3]|nr:D-alanyl-D-alanine carboxypeptidase family protein [Brucella abortus]ENR97018.1 hypothetical protein B973_00767 [Brucella abortus 80/28]ENS15926.1 hypothetical protein B995_00763 [Brucella abortus F1/06-B21]ENS27584.1 hypothetical protein C086_01014 [Brucella abortus F6/05-3]AIJ78105.1 D-alanyl-D-alanine carboxypeptidase family protein [Brucella abortus]